MAENTNCIIEGKETFANGVVKLRMRMVTSTRSERTTDVWGDITPTTPAEVIDDLEAIHSAIVVNELPNILHSVKASGMLEDPLSHVGFDYTLDFPMTEKNMFPYVLDFEMR